jgi:hypothetical protein
MADHFAGLIGPGPPKRDITLGDNADNSAGIVHCGHAPNLLSLHDVHAGLNIMVRRASHHLARHDLLDFCVMQVSPLSGAADGDIPVGHNGFQPLALHIFDDGHRAYIAIPHNLSHRLHQVGCTAAHRIFRHDVPA